MKKNDLINPGTNKFCLLDTTNLYCCINNIFVTTTNFVVTSKNLFIYFFRAV